MDETVAMRTGTGDYYYTQDGLGSVNEITDTGGVVRESYRYDTFGRMAILDANGHPAQTSSLGNPYGFTGREYDAETGLYYYRARYYDPGLGRFLEGDPIGYRQQMNVYIYVGNNPVNRIDPNGTLAIGVVVGALFGGVSGAVGSYAQGGHAKDIALGALIGAVSGGLIGAIDPSEGVGTIAAISGASGATGDVLGQFATSGNLKKVDINETIGAGLGSYMGGAVGTQITLDAVESGFGELGANILGGGAGLLHSTFGGWAGQQVGKSSEAEAAVSSSENCK